MDWIVRNRIVIAFAVLSVGACGANETATKPSLPPITPIMVPPAIAASVTEGSLEGRAWAWRSTELANNERMVPDASERYTIEFQSDGRVQLRADCNRGGGRYAAGANQSLSMTAAATTKMGCPSGSKGTEFVRQLAEVVRYDFTNGDLVLTLTSNAGKMRFMPVAR